MLTKSDLLGYLKAEIWKFLCQASRGKLCTYFDQFKHTMLYCCSLYLQHDTVNNWWQN